MRNARVEMWRRRTIVHLSVSLRWILCAVLVAVTDYFFSLVIESWVLLSARVIKTIRSEKNLVLSLIVRTSVRASSRLTVTASSHLHRRLAGRNTWPQLLASVLLLVCRIHVVSSTSDSLVRGRLLIRVLAHDRTSDQALLVNLLLSSILAIRIIVIRNRGAIKCSVVPPINSISRVGLTSLCSIEVLACASILRHI